MHLRPLVLFSALSLLLISAAAHAQGGCIDSPENPTVVLALIGSAAAAASAVKTRLRSHARSNKNR